MPQNPTLLAVARTSGNIRSPPSPLARGLLAAAGVERTARPPHRCGSVVVRYFRRSPPSKMQSAESWGDNLRLSSSCSAPSSRASGRQATKVYSGRGSRHCYAIKFRAHSAEGGAACCAATRGGVGLVGDGEFDGGGGGEAGAGERGLVDHGAVGPLGSGEGIYFAAQAGGIEAALGVGFGHADEMRHDVGNLSGALRDES